MSIDICPDFGDIVSELTAENEKLTARIAELEYQLEDWTNNGWAEDYKARIAELEGKVDQLTAHSDIERQDDKCSKPEPNVCEACGGDGTVVLRDGYRGQLIVAVKCIYCNGIGRVNKERER